MPSSREPGRGGDAPAAHHPFTARILDRPELGILDLRPDGEVPPPFVNLVLERRDCTEFSPEPVPEDVLESILKLALQAPSAYNLQPWRLVVVQDAAHRRRLGGWLGARGKVAEAPVLIVAAGLKEQWREALEPVLRAAAQLGAEDPAAVDETRQRVEAALEAQDMAVWVTRQTMVAVTLLVLAAEAYGLGSGVVEAVDRAGLKGDLALPRDAEVVAVVALGKPAGPRSPHPGRFALEALVSRESFDRPFTLG